VRLPGRQALYGREAAPQTALSLWGGEYRELTVQAPLRSPVEMAAVQVRPQNRIRADVLGRAEHRVARPFGPRPVAEGDPAACRPEGGIGQKREVADPQHNSGVADKGHVGVHAGLLR
jgi:hypothetical protein